MSLFADERRLRNPLDWLAVISFFTFSVFLTGFFYVINAVDLYKIFLLAVILPALPGVPRGLKLLRRDPLFLLLLAFLGFMMLSSAWSYPVSIRLFVEQGRYALLILAFIVIGSMQAERYPCLFARLLQLLAVVAALSALVSLVWWYSRHPFPESRVLSFAILNNPNPVGFAYGLVGVLALGLGLRAHQRWQLFGFVGCALLLFLMVWFTQSRTAIAASVIASGLFLLSLGNKRRALLALTLLVTTLVLLMVSVPELGRSIGARSGTIHTRLMVWDEVIAQVRTSLWYGHGLLSDNLRLVMGQRLHAHNAFLAALRDGGVIGLGLFLSLLGYAGWRAIHADEGQTGLLLLSLLVFGVVCMLTDQDRVITRPRELWIFLWLPLLLVMISPRLNRALQAEGEQAADSSTAGSSGYGPRGSFKNHC